MELNDIDLKKFHHINIVGIFRVLLNTLSFYLNKWTELNLIEKDKVNFGRTSKVFWLVVKKCDLVSCNFLSLEWIKILSLVRKGYVCRITQIS